MVEHEVDEHTRRRDIEPERKCPTSNSFVALKVTAQSPVKSHQSHRHYHRRQNGVREQDGKVNRANPTCPGELGSANLRVINQVTEQKQSGSDHRTKHARFVGFDVAFSDKSIAEKQKASACGVQYGINRWQISDIKHLAITFAQTLSTNKRKASHAVAIERPV